MTEKDIYTPFQLGDPDPIFDNTTVTKDGAGVRYHYRLNDPRFSSFCKELKELLMKYNFDIDYASYDYMEIIQCYRGEKDIFNLKEYSLNEIEFEFEEIEQSTDQNGDLYSKVITKFYRKK